MTDDKREGGPGAETLYIAAAGAPGRKHAVVLRVLRGASLETVARELRVEADQKTLRGSVCRRTLRI